MSAVEIATNGEILAATRPEADRVVVIGVVTERMKVEATGNYAGLHGIIDVERYLYREEGVRSGPTIDPIALRCGLVEGRMTPAAVLSLRALVTSRWERGLELLSIVYVTPIVELAA